MQFYIITYTGRPIGESGESCKANYDLDDACKKCGTGAKLKGKLKVKGVSNVSGDFIETLDGDYMISNRLYKKVKDLHPDFQLYPVVDNKNIELGYYHLNSHTILPPSEDSSSGLVIEDQCPQCIRNGYFNDSKIGELEKGIPTKVSPVSLHYKESDIRTLLSNKVLQTWECLGLSNRDPKNGHIVRYARPIIIVNQDLKSIFESQGLSKIKFEPIKIE